MMQKRGIRSLALPASLALAMFAGAVYGAGTTAPATAAAAAPTPTRLAVINIQKVFPALKEKQAGDAQIVAFITKFNTDKHDKEVALKKMSDALDGPNSLFKPGSDDYKKQQLEVRNATIAYRVFLQVAQEDLASMTRLKTEAVYRSMNQAVKKYAEAHGIAIVFVVDDADFSDAENVDQLKAGIAMRKIMYANPDYDITAKIIESMNAEYVASH